MNSISMRFTLPGPFLIFVFTSLFPLLPNPKKAFDPEKGIHPYYLNQMNGYNHDECEEKNKCRAECPEIVKRSWFNKGLTQVYLRKECIRKCDELTCKLNNSH